ncbi:hypothetical protein [Kribbella sp.]|uniref:hypothetical protein n=1 Tax=Kribbella sp. TaxID=1871183 RepID=UPI002D22F39B|nr:hypothetical protein [Kribbella sp.]HZX05694.1 hypothetical protein [Kribbella sp.]
MSTCWCCGAERDERELVGLGLHPEVQICLRCTVAVRQRGREREDQLRPTPLTNLRSGVRRTRELVIRRGWHRLPVVGAFLRRLNRHLP